MRDHTAPSHFRLPPGAKGLCQLRHLRSDQDSAALAGRCFVHGHSAPFSGGEVEEE